MATLPDATEDIPQEASSSDIDTRGGLVKHHHIRVTNQGESCGELTLVPPAEVLAETVLVGIEAHALNDLTHLCYDVLSRDATDACVVAQSLADRELVRKGVKLRAVAEMTASSVTVALQVPAPEEDVALVRIDVPSDHTHRGRLAGAVDSQQPKALASCHAHGDAADRVDGLALTTATSEQEGLGELRDDQPVLRAWLHARGDFVGDPRRLFRDCGVLKACLLPCALGQATKDPAEGAPFDQQSQSKPDQ
mmetsp:Transcript_39483/g.86234  ORF Transcript_39483/g.86234 Transcript_39483/m.86234 type:complete len:251 (-) Transcript_39483:799-1551(-)